MLRRLRRKDPVTPGLYYEVIARDLRVAGGCVAAFLDLSHGCRDQWGTPFPPENVPLTLDHVQDGGGRMGKRARSDREHLVSLCYHAHLNGWATSHRPLLRLYLHGANEAVA